MKAILITNTKAKIKKCAQIVRLYNELTGSNEKSKCGAPHLCVIAAVPGVRGGVWLELLGGKVNVIYYAAFEKQFQRQGCLKACLKALRQEYVIDGVQVDIFGDQDVWKNLGFPRQDMVNMAPTMTHHSEQEFRQLCLSANG